MLLSGFVIAGGFFWAGSQARRKKRLWLSSDKRAKVSTGMAPTAPITLDNIEISKAEKEANHDVIISSSALGSVDVLS